MHGVRGASGGVSARGPSFPPDLRPPRAPLAPAVHPPETLRCEVGPQLETENILRADATEGEERELSTDCGGRSPSRVHHPLSPSVAPALPELQNFSWAKGLFLSRQWRAGGRGTGPGRGRRRWRGRRRTTGRRWCSPTPAPPRCTSSAPSTPRASACGRCWVFMRPCVFSRAFPPRDGPGGVPTRRARTPQDPGRRRPRGSPVRPPHLSPPASRGREEEEKRRRRTPPRVSRGRAVDRRAARRALDRVPDHRPLLRPVLDTPLRRLQRRAGGVPGHQHL